MPEEKKKVKKTKKAAAAEEKPAEAAPAADEAPKEAAAPKPAKPAAKAQSQKNVFALFNQQQIAEFKEAFQMMDLDRDGSIGEEDLAGIWQQTGREPENKVIKEMIAECPEKLNFTRFLNLFGEKMHGTDPEATLKAAFETFDPEKAGMMEEKYFKDLICNHCHKFDTNEYKNMAKEAPINGGKLDYVQFVHFIKRGKEEEEG